MELWSGYLSFYRQELSEQVTRTTFARLCDATDGMFALVALDAQERPIGFAHAVVHPSTWAPNGYCYLEDLFVARERGVERMYWHTQQFNGAARSLYDHVGRLTSMVVYERDV